jgi:uncharacterized protein (TIGR00369 family)
MTAGPSRGEDGGRDPHFGALEALYAAAPINGLFPSTLRIAGEGRSEIDFTVDEKSFHAAGAVHGTVYFKMLDDAAFYAVNSVERDVFVLTTAFNMHLERPIAPGRLHAEGRWVSGRRRVFIAESRLLNAAGEEVARGTGTFMRSKIPLVSLPAYAAAAERRG